MNPSFTLKQYIIYALSGYTVTILFLIFVSPLLFPKPKAPEQAALRVDLVGMPDKQTSQKKITKKSNDKNDKSELKKIKRAQELALKKIRAKQKALKQKQQKEDTQKQLNKGNQVSKGSSLQGVQKIQYNNYVADITSLVKSEWSLPDWLAQQNLEAQIAVKINANGEVMSKQIVRSSGNTTFDTQALQAIQNASPFSYPPNEILLYLSNVGIIFIFP